MASKSVCFVLLSVLVAYYIYKPLPDNIEEKWKVMLLDATFRSLGHVVSLIFIKCYLFLQYCFYILHLLLNAKSIIVSEAGFRKHCRVAVQYSYSRVGGRKSVYYVTLCPINTQRYTGVYTLVFLHDLVLYLSNVIFAMPFYVHSSSSQCSKQLPLLLKQTH